MAYPKAMRFFFSPIIKTLRHAPAFARKISRETVWGGFHKERCREKTRRVELVVPAVRDPVWRSSMAAPVQQGRAGLDGNTVFLLVSAAVGVRQRHFHRDRVFRHGRMSAPRFG